ncbi:MULTISPECIES: hypothetical protein [Flavobacterium]|uniref:TonB C-terminal domain-containing protein n=2 Tax=Flavobacterium TaxID=237 RepID=A0A437UC49_9FLAO|nr:MULTISPECIES: hypothetical protein [Flavobacterium]OWP84974.1 hypothetical protein BWK59_02405 [Flavobacterium davisii]QYS89959.1 hypothetical protein JJC05_07395 [Flavobacterium davisii]RVU91169.1 hypothetical protein EH230_09805 [Flavobacterium columnare]SPE77255.1 hypothetical protein FLACOL_01248 [Flavobacterium columnare]
MNLIKNNLLVLIASFSVVSCQYFEKKEPNKEDLLKKELSKINWYTVDEYPSIMECESIADKELRKECFFQTLTKNIYEKITTDTVKTLLPRLDSLKIRVVIYPNSKVDFSTILPSSAVDPEYTDSILRSKLVHFPVIEPAIKRGMKVKSEFFIPIKLK